MSPLKRIAIDCMGGDFGLPITLPATLRWLSKNSDISVVLVGDAAAIHHGINAFQQAAAQHRPVGSKSQATVINDRVSVVAADEVVLMDDPIEVALRRKKRSSMRLALELVKEEKAEACLSAGNTGALMAISRYVLKTLEGIDRPAIASVIPNRKGGLTTMLDLGANVDCSPQHLLEFAVLGSAMVSALESRAAPSIGLLNIGEELIKGNEVVKAAAELLRNSQLNFQGNVEGDDIFKGTTDIVVCDGFVGNVALKTAEGVVQFLSEMLRRAFKRNFLTRIAALGALPVLRGLKHQMDHRQYNGAVLLGLRGIVVKSHGSADESGFEAALGRTRQLLENNLLQRTREAVQLYQQVGLNNELSPVANNKSNPSLHAATV